MSFKWYLAEAGAPQDSVSGSLLFLVYTIDLLQEFCCNAKLFNGDISLFSTNITPVISTSNLNEELLTITHWAYEWRKSFDPDIAKKVQENFFLKEKRYKLSRYTVHEYNDNLLKNSFLIVCKCFIRAHLGYGDVFCDQLNLSDLSNKIESFQWNPALAIRGAIRRTSEEKLYQELGFESRKYRRWLRRLFYLHKILNSKQPAYVDDLIPPFQKICVKLSLYVWTILPNCIFKKSFSPMQQRSAMD